MGDTDGSSLFSLRFFWFLLRSSIVSFNGSKRQFHMLGGWLTCTRAVQQIPFLVSHLIYPKFYFYVLSTTDSKSWFSEFLFYLSAAKRTLCLLNYSGNFDRLRINFFTSRKTYLIRGQRFCCGSCGKGKKNFPRRFWTRRFSGGEFSFSRRTKENLVRPFKTFR